LNIYLTVTLDTECDKGPGWKVRQPLSFKNIIEGVPERLQPLFHEFDIKPTYLLSPEVLREENCVSLFQTLDGSVELGTHLHAEFIEPEATPLADNTSAFQSDFTPEAEFEKLRNLTELFADRFGYHPGSFRAGRFGISRHTLGFLEKLGYNVDSSVTPYMWWWRRKGEGVNFLGAPDQPYFPSSDDFRKPGKMNILEVPVTLNNPFWDKFPKKFLRLLNPLNRLQTICLNVFFKNKLSCQWLRPTYSTSEEMLSVTDYEYHKIDEDQVFLCMMFHSNEATAGMSPYNASRDDVDRFLERLRDYLYALFEHYEVQSIGLSEAPKLL